MRILKIHLNQLYKKNLLNFRIKNKFEIVGQNSEESEVEDFQPTSIRLGNDDTSSSDDSEDEDESSRMSDFIDDTGVQGE